MKHFGEKLRTLREQHELSQRKLGEKLGVSGTHVGKLERNEKTPNVAMVLNIADFFGVDVNLLIRDERDLS